MIEKNSNKFKGLDRLAKLLDAQFTIPGTNIRFGLDALIGLIQELVISLHLPYQDIWYLLWQKTVQAGLCWLVWY